MTLFKTLETERLFIRPTIQEDASFILELMNSPKWLEFIGDRNIKTLKNAQEYIELKMTPQFKRLGYGNHTVICKRDDSKIGSVGLYDREGIKGIDLGFAFLPKYEGKGYAFEASYRLQQAALEEFGLNFLSAITTKNNVASQRLLVKLKFELTGTIVLPSDTEALLLYTFKRNS